MPRTNNSIENLFLKMMRKTLKGSGNAATVSIITRSGESLAIFQNIAIPEYRNLVFGNEDLDIMVSEVEKYRKRLKKPIISRSRIEKLVSRSF